LGLGGIIIEYNKRGGKRKIKKSKILPPNNKVHIEKIRKEVVNLGARFLIF